MIPIMNKNFYLEIKHICKQSGARYGILHTPHGDVEVPMFMPVGTLATVKTLSVEEIKAIGSGVILSNTYHLSLRPGEDIVQKALDNLIKNKTVFLIAHRFTTIKNANRIIVIDNGEIVETGTHDELMQIQNGQYKHLYEMQFRAQKSVEV